jgi:hypothetical protein
MLVHERVPQNYWLPPASPGGRLRVDLFGAEELIAADWKPGSTPRGGRTGLSGFSGKFGMIWPFFFEV